MAQTERSLGGTERSRTQIIRVDFCSPKAEALEAEALAPETSAINSNLTAERLYEELTALIDREIAKLRRGEQAALVGFTNVVQLARNACRELAAPVGALTCSPEVPFEFSPRSW